MERRKGAGTVTEAVGFLRWRSWGASDRRALLLHGTGSSSGTWWQVGPALAEAGWRVKAPDLPSHGASPRAETALTPQVAARWLVHELAARPLDLVIGQGFGAATALALEQIGPPVRHLVLDDLPGPHRVDWHAEASALRRRAAQARRDVDAEYARLRESRPEWADEDCRQVIGDLAHCCTTDIAAGLLQGAEWPWLEGSPPRCPTLVMAGPEPDQPVGSTGSSLLRGEDRATARLIADAWAEHGTDPEAHRGRTQEWLRGITDFTG